MLVYSIRVSLLVVLFGFVNADGIVHMKWICYSTVCEEDIHFCNEQSKRCEACEDYAGQCFSNIQQINCTKYCMNSRLRQVREQGCKVPTVQNDHQTGSQTQVKYKQSIEVECADGYTIVGGTIITCEEYGKWSAAPICKAVTCKLPTTFLANGYFTFILPRIQNKTAISETDILVGSRLRFHCTEGFRLNTVKDMTCTFRGQWDSDKLPSCLRENVKKSGENSETKSTCVLPWVLVWVMFGILILVIISFTIVLCQRKSKKTCHSRSAEPSVHTTKNGEANGFVPNNYDRDEAESLLLERCMHDQSAASTNLKHLEEVSEHGEFKLEESDTASTSSGKSGRHVSYKTTTTGFYNTKPAFKQQEPDNTASQRDAEVITPGKNVQPAVKQQDGQVVVYNDVNVTQNVFGHKTEHCESCQSPTNPRTNQTSTTDTTNGIPVQETNQTKSPLVRCICPVQPRTDDTGRSMEQASMPRQETTDHATPKTYATPQTTVLPQATVQTKL